MFIDQDKTRQLLALLEQEHFRYQRQPEAKAALGEIDLTTECAVEIRAPASPLLRQMETDFRCFLEKCLGVSLVAAETAQTRIVFALSGKGSAVSFRDESFKVAADNAGVTVTADTERGLLQASHFIERECARRGGPFWPAGTMAKKPQFTPRLSQTAFSMGDGSLDHPYLFTDRYLSLMSHFSINGIHLYSFIRDYCCNTAIPELNCAEYERNIARIRELCRRTAVYGIDLYLHMNTGLFPATDPLFQKRPDLKGARLAYPVDFDHGGLCSSHPDVLRCYNETFQNLFARVPELAGTVIIIGGECFIHCFTRPRQPLTGGTCCPRCSGHDPAADVARLVNGIGAAVHVSNPGAKVFVWPYSAFSWSGDRDPDQLEMVRQLNPDVELLSTFETPHIIRFGSGKAALIDYNIVNIGPSRQFKNQSAELKKKGKRHYAKFESSTEPGWYTLPYLPVHYRWLSRIDALRRERVPGYIAQWRFYGFTGSLPEELLAESTWRSQNEADSLLRQIARRDFGTADNRLLEGWKKLSDTWPKIPNGHLMFGERNFYMKGPLYLGPAHPLIFDVQKRYGLGWKFCSLRGDALELKSPEALEQMEKNSPPRYSSDLLFVHPFGVKTAQKAFATALASWQEGGNLVAAAFGPQPNRRAQLELNICRMLEAHVRTTLNVIRFYQVRDALFAAPGNQATLEADFNRLTAILDDEIRNAEQALILLEDDFRLGYGHSYGQVYDAEMVREKIRQCRQVRDEELPDLKSCILFHTYIKYT